MTTVTTEWSLLSKMRMCCCSKGMLADFLCPTTSGLPPSCVRQCSRGAVRAVGTGMGFPTVKLSKRAQGFPNLPTAGCVLTFTPWRRLGKDFGKQSTARWPCLLPLSCGEEQNQSLAQEGRENLSRLPCTGRVPAGTASSPVNICLKVQCGWKACGRRQRYMDAWRVRQVGTLPLHDVAGIYSMYTAWLIYPTYKLLYVELQREVQTHPVKSGIPSWSC